MSELGERTVMGETGSLVAAERMRVRAPVSSAPPVARTNRGACQHTHYALFDMDGVVAITPSLRRAETHAGRGGDVKVCRATPDGSFELGETGGYETTVEFHRHAGEKRLRYGGPRQVDCQHAVYVLYDGLPSRGRFVSATCSLERAQQHGKEGGSWVVAKRDYDGTIRLRESWSAPIKRQGFTLVELMAVVAIIGVLGVHAMASAGWIEKTAYIPVNLQWHQVDMGIKAFLASSELYEAVEQYQIGLPSSGVFQYLGVDSIRCSVGVPFPPTGHKVAWPEPSQGCQELGVELDGPTRGTLGVGTNFDHSIFFWQAYRVSPHSRMLMRVTYYKREGREITCSRSAEMWSDNPMDITTLFAETRTGCN